MCTTDDQGFSLEQLDCEQKGGSHPLKLEVKHCLCMVLLREGGEGDVMFLGSLYSQ